MSREQRLGRVLADVAAHGDADALAADLAADAAFAADARALAALDRLLASAMRDEVAREARIAAVVASARRWRRRAGARRVIVAIAALLLVALAVPLLARRDATRFVVADAGDARLTRAGAARPAGGARLRPGDGLVTGDAACELACADGTRLRLAARSDAAVLDDGRGLRLAAGEISASVAHRAPDRALRIATPRATATVVGTRLAVTAAADGDRVSVEEGVVRVDAGGASVDVAAGASAAIAADGSLTRRHSLRVDRFDDGIPAGWDAGERARPPMPGAWTWALRGTSERFAPTANTVSIRQHGWTTYGDDLGVDCDVLVTAPVPWVGVQVYDPATAQNYARSWPAPTPGRWLRLSFRLRDLQPVLRPEPMRPGDALDSLYVIAGELGRQELWVERVELWRDEP